jgi:putative ABC transport system permease protein
MRGTLIQTARLLVIGLKSLPGRRASSAVVVFGICSVVAVLVSVLAIANGLNRTVNGNGRADTAILLSAQAQGESSSQVSTAELDAIAVMHEVALGDDNTADISPEIVTMFPAVLAGSGDEGNIRVRGIGAKGWTLHPNIRITDGRAFRPGLQELLVGSGVAAQFRGLGLGDKVHMFNSVWTVTGHFESQDIHNSEVLVDANTVQSALGMGGYYSAIYARMRAPEQFHDLQEDIARDPTLHLDAFTEAKYYETQARQMTEVIVSIAYVIGVIMALGALLGAIHSLYIAADTRKIEMATLLALGFRPVSVMLSFLCEALLLSVIGGCCGAVLAWLIFNDHTTSTASDEMSQVVFQLHVSAALISTGLLWAFVIGLLGALIPAVHTSRIPAAEALRH